MNSLFSRSRVSLRMPVFLTAVLLFTPRLTHAAGGVNLINPLGSDDIRVVMGTIIQAAIGLSGSLALLMIIYGGFLWLTSAGDSEKIKKGQEILKWSILGLLVLFSAYTITNAIISGILTGTT